MQNTLKSEENQNSKKTKFQLFALIGVLAVTAIAGGIYYFLQPESVPPSLEVKRNTYQGFSKDVEFGSVKWEKSDLKTYDDKLAELKKAGVNTSTAVKAEKNRTNILFALKDTNLKEIIDATSRIEGGRVIWAVYQGTFIMTQNDYFNTVDSKGNVVAKIVDTSNTVETEKIKIKENQAVFLMADYDASNPLLRSELDVPAKDVTLDSLTKGWHAIAMKDASVLLKDVGSTTYSLFGTKNNKDFTKLKTLDEKKNYNKIVWINVKVDKLQSQFLANITVDKSKTVITKMEENIAPVVTGKAVVVAAIDSAQNMPIAWTVVDTKQTQYTDSAKTKPTLSYTWKFFDITNPATPVELWKLTPEWGSKTDETGVTTPALDGDCFKQLYGEDGKPLVTGRDWTCTQMTLESARLAPSKEYKMEITAFDGSLSSAPASVTFKTKAVTAKPADTQNTKLEVKNVKVSFNDVDLGTTGTVELDDKGIPTKELKFMWDSTYNAATIAQYSDAAKTKPTLSYIWMIQNADTGKLEDIPWSLSQEWGGKNADGTLQGVTSGDDTCFKQVYDSSGNPLVKDNRDWICTYTYLPGGIKFAANSSYNVYVTAFDGKTLSTQVSATFKTAAKFDPKSILDLANPQQNISVNDVITKDVTDQIQDQLQYGQYDQYIQYNTYSQIGQIGNLIDNLEVAPKKLSAPDLSSGVTCDDKNVCSLVINLDKSVYGKEGVTISGFEIIVKDEILKIEMTDSKLSQNEDLKYLYDLGSLDLTQNQTFAAQVAVGDQYSPWASYDYTPPSITSFSVVASQGSGDMAKLDLSWVDSSYNQDTDEYKILKKSIGNELWAKCLIENIKKSNITVICGNNQPLGDFGSEQLSDIEVYGNAASLHTTQSINKYDEVKIRIQRCIKNSNKCYPKSEEVYYHPAPILSISGNTLYWKPLDLDQSKINSYTITYRETEHNIPGYSVGGGLSGPKTFEIVKDSNNVLAQSSKEFISTIIKLTQDQGSGTTAKYEISIHKNYDDGTINLESNKINVNVSGSSVTLASANPDYGFASLFDSLLDDLFNIFK